MSKKGRPSVDTDPVTVRLPRDVLEAIDTYRRKSDDLPTRPGAIRDILRDWLRQNGYLSAEK